MAQDTGGTNLWMHDLVKRLSFGLVLAVSFAGLCLLPMRGMAAVFNVRDYGAVGNGERDDSASLQKAIDAAVHAGPGGKVLIPSGHYLLGHGAASAAAHFRLAAADNLTIVGESGTVLVSQAPELTFFEVVNSRNVTFRRMTLTRSPVVFSQVTVRSIDPLHETVRVALQPGYQPLDSRLVGPGKFLIVFSEPETGSWGDHSAACAWYNPQDPSVCWPPEIRQRRLLENGEWDLTLNTAPQASYVGKPAVVWGGAFKGSAFTFKNTYSATVEDVNYFAGGANGGFVLSHNTGDFVFRRFTVDVAPASGQYISAIGGSMVFNNHISLLLDQVTIARVWDDAVNMGANFSRVFKQDGPRLVEVDSSRGDFRIGDTLAIWDWAAKHERGRAKITAVTQITASPHSVQIELDRDAIIGHAGYAPIKSTNNDTDGIDRVIDLNSAGSLHIMHSRFQSLHARDLLIKASDSVIESSEFYDTVAAGLLVGPEFFWDEGPTVHNLTIKNNTFRNVSGSNVLVRDGTQNDFRGTSGIRILGNRFIGYGQFQHGVMGDPNSPVVVENAHDVEVKNNTESAYPR